MSARVLYAPDWMMVGIPMPEGDVAIIASQTLTEAEIHAITEFEEPFWAPLTLPRMNLHYEIHGIMHTLVLTRGATYAEALRRLLDTWKPDEPASETKALSNGSRQALEAK